MRLYRVLMTNKIAGRGLEGWVYVIARSVRQAGHQAALETPYYWPAKVVATDTDRTWVNYQQTYPPRYREVEKEEPR